MRFPKDIWRQLNGTDFRLLDELSFLSRGRGYCEPSQIYLCKKLLCHRSTITRSSVKLSRLGLLRVQRRIYRRRDGSLDTHTNVYRLAHWLAWKVGALRRYIADVALMKHRPKKTEERPEKREKFFTSLSEILEKWKSRRPPPH